MRALYSPVLEIIYIALRKVPADANVAHILLYILKEHMFTKKAEQLLGLEHFMSYT